MATTLLAKLLLKPGHRVLLQNVPADTKAALTKALAETTLATRGPVDAVVLFVGNLTEARKLAPKAIKAAGAEGMLWVAYPKGTGRITTDINRDSLREAVETLGWQSVRLIALDETWSVMRFRPADDVGR